MRNSRSLPLMRSIHTSPLCNDGFPIAPRSESILAVLAGTTAAFSVFVEDGPAAAPHPLSIIARKISAAAASRPNVVCPSIARSGFLARMHSYGDPTSVSSPCQERMKVTVRLQRAQRATQDSALLSSIDNIVRAELQNCK